MVRTGRTCSTNLPFPSVVYFPYVKSHFFFHVLLTADLFVLTSSAALQKRVVFTVKLRRLSSRPPLPKL